MMSSAQPPTLPITVQSAAASGGPDPVSSGPFRQFVGRFVESAQVVISKRRPWSELADRSALSRPDSITDAASRIRKNLAYFRVNYLVIVAGVLALSLLTNPFSLLVLLMLFAAWSFLYLFRPAGTQPIIMGRQLSDHETLGGLVMLTIFSIFLTSVGSILMSALVVGSALVAVHGALRVPDDLFLDETDGGGAASGLLSFLGGPTSNVVAAGGPAVTARV